MAVSVHYARLSYRTRWTIQPAADWRRDSKDLATRAMDFAPGMWLNPLPNSVNDFGAVIYESAFARCWCWM